MIASSTISMTTQGHCDVVDITRPVSEAVAAAGAKEGSVLLFVAGSTAGLTTIEYEPGLVADLKSASGGFERRPLRGRATSTISPRQGTPRWAPQAEVTATASPT